MRVGLDCGETPPSGCRPQLDAKIYSVKLENIYEKNGNYILHSNFYCNVY